MAKEDLNQLWYLFCPHEVMKVKGYCLEDCFGDEWEQKVPLDCVQDYAPVKTRHQYQGHCAPCAALVGRNGYTFHFQPRHGEPRTTPMRIRA